MSTGFVRWDMQHLPFDFNLPNNTLNSLQHLVVIQEQTVMSFELKQNGAREHFSTISFRQILYGHNFKEDKSWFIVCAFNICI